MLDISTKDLLIYGCLLLCGLWAVRQMRAKAHMISLLKYDMNQLNTALIEERAAHTKDVNNGNEQIQQLTQRVDRSSQEVTDLRGKLQQKENSLNEEKQRTASLIAAKDSHANTLSHEIAQKTTAVVTAQADVARLNGEVTNLKAEVDSLKKENEGLKKPPESAPAPTP